MIAPKSLASFLNKTDMTGEYDDRDFVVTRGDTRIAMTIGRNEHTIKFGRKNRFLVDDLESGSTMSFDLSKPLRVGHIYNGHGVLKFVLSESDFTEFDNLELGIADYYKYFDSACEYHEEKKGWF